MSIVCYIIVDILLIWLFVESSMFIYGDIFIRQQDKKQRKYKKFIILAYYVAYHDRFFFISYPALYYLMPAQISASKRAVPHMRNSSVTL